jgi:hypothetical protein
VPPYHPQARRSYTISILPSHDVGHQNSYATSLNQSPQSRGGSDAQYMEQARSLREYPPPPGPPPFRTVYAPHSGRVGDTYAPHTSVYPQQAREPQSLPVRATQSGQLPSSNLPRESQHLSYDRSSKVSSEADHAYPFQSPQIGQRSQFIPQAQQHDPRFYQDATVPSLSSNSPYATQPMPVIPVSHEPTFQGPTAGHPMSSKSNMSHRHGTPSFVVKSLYFTIRT